MDFIRSFQSLIENIQLIIISIAIWSAIMIYVYILTYESVDVHYY